ncbi:branched-chain amino acid transport system II carrier protein [candidate division TM6 bacterium RIFCSPHIGHO2_12_FULL_38_8]|nr:MAG: branched-chain amino acid transport system II carrier protein [candidate division TM6 bacterium RIFCSPHIGHO2_12_FULL_38_8]
MKKESSIKISTIGFAIFTMLFGAGNMIYPVKAGVMAGSKYLIGIAGFLLTGVLIPIIGLVAMILFNGDYAKFFNRAGKIPGFLSILFCMLIIGPFLVIPRCVTVSYEMLFPLLPNVGLILFSVFFCLLTFACSYKESKLLDLLGKWMSPFIIVFFSGIIIWGLMHATNTIEQSLPSSTVFLQQVVHGFQTLDLLGALFFAYIIIRLINVSTKHSELSSKQIALMCLKGSVITAALMTSFYIGFILLSAFHANLVSPDMNGAEMFRIIATHIVGCSGIAFLIFAVLIKCLATATALTVVFAEYLRNEIFDKTISYLYALLITLGITLVVSNLGLTTIISWGYPIITAGYPIIVTITLCNIAYKLFNFEWIKLPVFVTTMIMIYISVHPWL